MPPFSIVYCYRNRDVQRVKRSLDSLATQNDNDFEVIFIDYGSDPVYSTPIKQLLSAYSFVKYLYNDTRGLPWNRAHALNTGIRMALSDFIFTADVDLIFTRDFSRILLQLKGDAIAHFFSVYLTPRSFGDWENIYAYTNFIKTKNQGLGISLIPKHYLEECGGYDEFFSFWGYEDNELYQRMSALQLKANYYNDKVIAYHQWHPHYYDDGKIFPQGWRGFMKDYLESLNVHGKSLNLTEQGRIYNFNDRPALRKLLNEQSEFEELKGSLKFIRFRISRLFYQHISGEIMCCHFMATNYRTYESTKAIKFLKFTNRLLDKLNRVPYLLQSKFSDLNPSVFQVRDLVVYFIYENKLLIQDFAIEVADDETAIKFVIVKK